MKVLRFARAYPKLNDTYFTTIRLKTRFKKGDHVNVYLRDKGIIGVVKVVARYSFKIREIPTRLLVKDTGKPTRKEALKLLREFYPELTSDTHVNVLFLKWIWKKWGEENCEKMKN